MKFRDFVKMCHNHFGGLLKANGFKRVAGEDSYCKWCGEVCWVVTLLFTDAIKHKIYFGFSIGNKLLGETLDNALGILEKNRDAVCYSIVVLPTEFQDIQYEFEDVEEFEKKKDGIGREMVDYTTSLFGNLKGLTDIERIVNDRYRSRIVPAECNAISSLALRFVKTGQLDNELYESWLQRMRHPHILERFKKAMQYTFDGPGREVLMQLHSECHGADH